MPTRRLPAQPDLLHLEHHAKDLLKAHRARDPRAIQRLREFHPRMREYTDTEIAAMPLSLSDAQCAIAREYGFPTWPKLKAFVDGGNSAELELLAHERISNAVFRRAVDMLDAADAAGVHRRKSHAPRHASP